MSIDASITLDTFDVTGDDFIAIIESLKDCGWSLGDCGKISYMKDEYDWYDAELGKEREVYDSIRTVIENKGVTAISMTWENTQIGGSLLFIDSSTMMLSIVINPLRIKGMNIIDFSWYLERLRPLLYYNKVTHFECTQIL